MLVRSVLIHLFHPRAIEFTENIGKSLLLGLNLYFHILFHVYYLRTKAYLSIAPDSILKTFWNGWLRWLAMFSSMNHPNCSFGYLLSSNFPFAFSEINSYAYLIFCVLFNWLDSTENGSVFLIISGPFPLKYRKTVKERLKTSAIRPMSLTFLLSTRACALGLSTWRNLRKANLVYLYLNWDK